MSKSFDELQESIAALTRELSSQAAVHDKETLDLRIEVDLLKIEQSALLTVLERAQPGIRAKFETLRADEQRHFDPENMRPAS